MWSSLLLVFLVFREIPSPGMVVLVPPLHWARISSFLLFGWLSSGLTHPLPGLPTRTADCFSAATQSKVQRGVLERVRGNMTQSIEHLSGQRNLQRL